MGMLQRWPALAAVVAGATACLDIGDASEGKSDAGSGGGGVAGAAGWPGEDGAAGSPGNGGAAGCPSGQLACSGTCVEPSKDPNNCGACGNVCEAPTGSCWQGACECGLDAICDGMCVSLGSNKNNCGQCGNKCPAGYGCKGGSCCAGC